VVLVAGQFPAFQLKVQATSSDMMDMLLVPGCNKTLSQSSPIGQIVKGRSKPILDTVVGVNFASSASKSAQNLNYAARNSEHPDIRKISVIFSHGLFSCSSIIQIIPSRFHSKKIKEQKIQQVHPVT